MAHLRGRDVARLAMTCRAAASAADCPDLWATMLSREPWGRPTTVADAAAAVVAARPEGAPARVGGTPDGDGIRVSGDGAAAPRVRPSDGASGPGSVLPPRPVGPTAAATCERYDLGWDTDPASRRAVLAAVLRAAYAARAALQLRLDAARDGRGPDRARAATDRAIACRRCVLWRAYLPLLFLTAAAGATGLAAAGLVFDGAGLFWADVALGCAFAVILAWFAYEGAWGAAALYALSSAGRSRPAPCCCAGGPDPPPLVPGESPGTVDSYPDVAVGSAAHAMLVMEGEWGQHISACGALLRTRSCLPQSCRVEPVPPPRPPGSMLRRDNAGWPAPLGFREAWAVRTCLLVAVLLALGAALLTARAAGEAFTATEALTPWMAGAVVALTAAVPVMASKREVSARASKFPLGGDGGESRNRTCFVVGWAGVAAALTMLCAAVSATDDPLGADVRSGVGGTLGVIFVLIGAVVVPGLLFECVAFVAMLFGCRGFPANTGRTGCTCRLTHLSLGLLSVSLVSLRAPLAVGGSMAVALVPLSVSLATGLAWAGVSAALRNAIGATPGRAVRPTMPSPAEPARIILRPGFRGGRAVVVQLD